MTDLGPGAHTRVRRLPTKARYDESTIFEILDLAPYCHVSALVGDLPMALPTLHYREGHTLYVHSSQSNAILRNALCADHVAVTATLYDGIRLARSGFESSIAYRSAMVVGHAYEITDLAEKYRLLSAFVDKVVPGRSAEVRPMTDREVALTLVVAIDIEEGSAKVSSGPTEDSDEDLAQPVWSGVIPVNLQYGEPIADVRGAMASGEIPLAPSVARLIGRQ